MTLVSKLSLQLKQQQNKKQAKLYSTTMYTSASQVEAERAGVAVKGQGAVKQRTSVLLGTGGNHRETGGSGEMRNSPHHTQTQTGQGAIFSHTSDRKPSLPSDLLPPPHPSEFPLYGLAL